MLYKTPSRPGSSPPPPSPWRTLCLVTCLTLALTYRGVTAQEIGVDVCACSPRTFEFTFDFGLFCPPVNITTGDAIRDTSCSVGPFRVPSVEDLVPVAVQTIDIFELGQDLRVIIQENIAGNFADGDSFSYSSLVNIPTNIEEVNDVPRGIQMDIIGVNRFDEPILNSFVFTYTNDCQVYPVLEEGQSIGWVFFSNLGPGRSQFCPGFQTEAPSEPPTPPTETPTSLPTLAPVQPTQSPTSSPSAPPVISTPPPVTPPTSAPTPAPTEIMSMSMMFMDDMDLSHLEESLMEEFGAGKKSQHMTSGKKSETSGKKTKNSRGKKSSNESDDASAYEKNGKNSEKKGGKKSSDNHKTPSKKKSIDDHDKSGKKNTQVAKKRDMDYRSEPDRITKSESSNHRTRRA